MTKVNLKKLLKDLTLFTFLLYNINSINSYSTDLKNSKLIVPLVSIAELICVSNKEYQDKNGNCEVQIDYYDHSTQRDGTIEGEVNGFRDGVLDGWRYYFGVFKDKNGEKIDITIRIKKPLHLCDKDGWWVEQTEAMSYKAVLCENGKAKETYYTALTGVEHGVYSIYNDRIYIFDTLSRTDADYSFPDFLYRVGVADAQCNILKLGKPLPLDEVKKLVKKKCGYDFYYYSCIQSGGKAACYPRNSPGAEDDAAVAVGE